MDRKYTLDEIREVDHGKTFSGPEGFETRPEYIFSIDTADEHPRYIGRVAVLTVDFNPHTSAATFGALAGLKVGDSLTEDEYLDLLR
jgi:hypothetical protein